MTPLPLRPGRPAGWVRVAALTATVTTTAAPAVREALHRLGILDIPNHRSSHDRPVARGGGLACALGVVAGTVQARREGGGLAPAEAVAVAALTTTGLVDDVRGLPAPARLVVQTVAGAAAGRDARGRLLGAALYPAAVNIVNFMDGINGITGTTAVAWGTHAAMVGSASPAGPLVAGAGAGFLPWNVPTARLFLGDSGSYLVGSLVASGLVGAPSRREALVLAVPLLPYALDAGVTVLRRYRRGDPVTEAHREHAYQRLVHEQGLSHVQASAVHGLLVTGLGVLARTQRLGFAAAVGTVAGLGWALAPETVGAWRARRSAGRV